MRTIYTGIDIGTHHVKVIVAEAPERPDIPMHVLGTGTAVSKGMRHGYIVDQTEATRSIREAVARASAAAKTPIRKARIAIGGVSLDEIRSSGEISLTASSGIVTARDIDRAQTESERRASSKLVNRTILHTIPLEFRVDGTTTLGSPEGVRGTKLTVDTLLVTVLTQHYEDIISAVEASNIEVEDTMASPLAASLVTLTKSQKMAGVILANIGAETLSVMVFENNIPISLKTFPVGAADVTNQIALSFQIPLNEAENVKRGGVIGSDVPQGKMETIIVNRLKEMFTLVNAHLRDINRQRLLPAGIVITGGGSGLIRASDIARTILRLPSQIGQVGFVSRSTAVDATWAVAYGLCRWGFASDIAQESHSFVEVLKNTWEMVRNGFKSLLP
ncbi:MAG: Cell division protein FtsA [Candidatus Kaiserbacteria bacterium]|nr:Cell division protein FtsA [Candidatus Kaiserbacteria bacterium]